MKEKITEKELLENLKSISAELKKVRIERGLTQKEVSDRMDTTQGYIYQIESGKYNFSLKTFWKYCHAIGVDYSIIVNHPPKA